MLKLEKLANQYNLKFVAKEKIAVGKIGNVPCCISSTENTNICTVEINVNTQASGKMDALTKELKLKIKSFKSVYSSVVEPFNIKVQINISSQKKMDELEEVFAYIDMLMYENGLRECCSICGEDKPTDVYTINSEAKRICTGCSTELVNHQELMEIDNRAKKGSVLLGTVGAFVGAFIGGVIWIIMFQFNYIVSIAAFVAVVCAYKGYIMLSGKKDVKAAVISVIIAAIVLFLAHCLCWTIMITQEFEVTFFDAIAITPAVISTPEATDAFLADLGMGYVLMAVGAFSFIKNAIKNPTGKAELKQIDISQANV